MPQKKIILFLVEGPNDETALAAPLTHFFETSTTRVEISEIQPTYGDISSKDEALPMPTEVNKHLQRFLDSEGFYKEDIAAVVLLLDMDGAYIPDSAIVEDNQHSKTFYKSDQIRCMPKEKIVERNERKRRNMNHLTSLPPISKTIPFSMYFFSCNLDHVICGEANTVNKKQAAKAFHLKYGGDANAFISFFTCSELTLGGTYEASWAAIQQGLTSLQRHSNLNVLLTQYKKQGDPKS